MTLLLSSLGSIAGCGRPEAEGYAATVEGLPGGPPLAYWRLGETSGSQIIDRKGSRHGTYAGTVTAISGLPQDSDGAIDFGGTGSGEVPHDPGLALSTFSISLWFRLPTVPGEGHNWAIISKEQPGLNVGDFGVYLFGSEELIVQFQDASTTRRLATFPSIFPNNNYHLCVRADNTGFDAYLNGEYLDKNTSFTGAWASNTQPIHIGFAAQLTEPANAIIDEVALYDRVLSEAEVIELSQHTQAPVATNDSFVAPENQTTALNVLNNDIFVGQKANLTVGIVSQGSFGLATVRGDNDIDFAAGAVTQDQADSFTYRIIDQNGTSNTATVNLTVQDSASEGGGVLVYDWQADGSWIDSVALSARSGTNIAGTTSTSPSPNRWTDGASIGSGMVRAVRNVLHPGSTSMCFNRAPTGHPALEFYAASGLGSVGSVHIELWEPFTRTTTGPRHVRVVMEVKTCKSSDPTTHKANGLGPTSGPYQNFGPSYQNSSAHVKYFCQLYQGTEPRGPILTNWWGNSGLPVDRIGHMMQVGAGSQQNKCYIANFDRPSAAGFGSSGTTQGDISSPGYNGYWHRLEIEVRLTTPGLVPTNARRSNPPVEPTHTGDGFCRIYMTPDIDGELGTPGTRQLVDEETGLIFNPRFDDVGSFDDLHQTMNITGPWIRLSYGGSDPAQAASWSWVRRVQVYRHD